MLKIDLFFFPIMKLSDIRKVNYIKNVSLVFNQDIYLLEMNMKCGFFVFCFDVFFIYNLI